jgi:hypothetical protein
MIDVAVAADVAEVVPIVCTNATCAETFESPPKITPTKLNTSTQSCRNIEPRLLLLR